MPELETIRGVPIARVGTWDTSTGRWVCTPEQLADAVRASRDPSFRKGVLKIGHTDPRFDGTPAVGRLDNLRVDASGEVLLADLTGVPKWLAEVMNSAYPSRSVEASLGVVTTDGNAYAMVVTGLALLGETAPAIESLGDIAALYDQPTDPSTSPDSWVAAARVAASISKDGAVMPTPPTPPLAAAAPRFVAASMPMDDLVEAATRYAVQNGITGPWVREIWTDKVIVMGGDADDQPGYGDDLFEIDWTEADGVFTFTGPWEVRVQYQRINDQDGDPWDKPGPGVVTVPPDDDNAVTASAGRPGGESGVRLAVRPVRDAALKSIVPLRYGRGRGDVSASNPEEQSPVSDLAALVRERLGLDPSADDDAVTAALDALRAGTGQAGTDAPTPTTTAPTGTQAEPVAASLPADRIEQLVAERVAAAVRPFQDELSRASSELAARKEAERVRARDTLLASAVSAGKITPADRPKWQDMYDKSPDSAAAVEQVFASLAKGTAVPVAATSGAHTGGTEPAGDGFTEDEYRRLFPSDERAGV